MEPVLEALRSWPLAWALLLVGLAAALEYLLPPLPADSVVLASSLLVVAGSASFAAVYLSAVAGGALGAYIHFLLGQLLVTEDGRRLRVSPRIARWIGADALPRFRAAFQRYGLWVVVLNRAFPGVRAVTFLAAGASGLSLARVMLAGLVSNLAWTLLILMVGVRVGSDWEKIQAAFFVYERAIFGVTGSLVVLFVLLKLWQRQRRA